MDRVMVRLSVEALLDSHEEDHGAIEGREELAESLIGLVEDFLLDYTATLSEEDMYPDEGEVDLEEDEEDDPWT